MTQNEVSIIKNAVLDATEAYVDARLETLAFVQTQIGVVISSYKDTDSKHTTYRKYIHTVRCNATKQNPDGIIYNNVLSVGNVQFPNSSVVFLVAPNGQFSNQFILGKLDDTPCNIVGGSIRLGGTDETDAPIYLTSTPYYYHEKIVYGHIGSFYITQNGLRIEGTNHDISEITGKQFRLSEWKQTSSTTGYALSMMMDIDKSRVAINTNGYTNGGLIVSNAYGWDGDGNFYESRNGSRYIQITPTYIEAKTDLGDYTLGSQVIKFLGESQSVGDIGNLRIYMGTNSIVFTNTSNMQSASLSLS